jgi:hypothetical protein
MSFTNPKLTNKMLHISPCSNWNLQKGLNKCEFIEIKKSKKIVMTDNQLRAPHRWTSFCMDCNLAICQACTKSCIKWPTRVFWPGTKFHYGVCVSCLNKHKVYKVNEVEINLKLRI